MTAKNIVMAAAGLSTGTVLGVEDVFSTYLYAGNGATQTITNGIDLSGKGGLVWIKKRNAAEDHALFDTARGNNYRLASNTTAAQQSGWSPYFSFTSSGMTLGSDGATNGSGQTYVSWTFRKQEKFFDVVTYTGNGANRTIAHNLGSVPGCIIVKRTDTTGAWQVYHRSLGNTEYMVLNTTAASTGGATRWNSTTPTSTVFSLGTDATVNANGGTYVAYLFAHNAGGFGTAGTDNVISCGAFTTDSIGSATVNLGYEAQWILIKRADVDAGQRFWFLTDIMRGLSVQTSGTTSNTAYLTAETSNQEYIGSVAFPTATGFRADSLNNDANYIYIAIRRGPMKTPTTGASVFEPAFSTSGGPEYKSNTVISGFDSAINIYRPGYSDPYISFPYTAARLTGAGQILQTSQTNAEYNYSAAATFAWNTGWFNSAFGNDTNRESYMFKRAPSFHDVVCYTGAYPSNVTVTHNLGVTPEFIITKARSTAGYDWRCYHSALGIGTTIRLNLANAASAGTQYVSVSSTNFVVGNSGDTDNSGTTYVSYLFASCPGVSKVGSYTGTGANQTINCGFASGVRFVLIKRTDSTGDWYVYDTTRGMTSGTDPYILLNSVAAEVTGTNYVETIATGFRLIGSNAGTNANGGTYIYLAIA